MEVLTSHASLLSLFIALRFSLRIAAAFKIPSIMASGLGVQPAMDTSTCVFAQGIAYRIAALEKHLLHGHDPTETTQKGSAFVTGF